MSHLRELYQELILEHSKAPRNYRELTMADHRAEGYNPLCGDHFTVAVKIEGDSIRDVAFQGSGCAISKASASMMTQSVMGKTKQQAKELFEQFHRTVTGNQKANSGELGKLAVFAGVAEFPMRVKCATLAWHTLQAALDGKQEAVSTEQGGSDYETG
jgi:nitrogen fixation protein NifU and related proteins